MMSLTQILRAARTHRRPFALQITGSLALLALGACGIDGTIGSTTSALSSGSPLLGTWKVSPFPTQEASVSKYTKLTITQSAVTLQAICMAAYTGYTTAPATTPTSTETNTTGNDPFKPGFVGGYGSGYQSQVTSAATFSSDSIIINTQTYYNGGISYYPCVTQLKAGTFRYTLSANQLTITGMGMDAKTPDLVLTKDQ
jgi:hypothetical protein